MVTMTTMMMAVVLVVVAVVTTGSNTIIIWQARVRPRMLSFLEKLTLHKDSDSDSKRSEIGHSISSAGLSVTQDRMSIECAERRNQALTHWSRSSALEE